MTMTITLIVDYKLYGRLVERHHLATNSLRLPLTWLCGIPPPPLQIISNPLLSGMYFSSLADDI